MSPTDPPATGPAAVDPSVPVISVRGLRKSFGDNEVLKGIDFEVRRGGVIALIGPSGSGKTTVLRSLNSLSVPDGGTVTFASGLEIDFSTRVSKRDLLALRDTSAMVFQHYNLFPHKTVLENVIEGPVQVQRVPVATARADAERLLERVGLLDKRDSSNG
jgi:cystine transport system ATP-binding protein